MTNYLENIFAKGKIPKLYEMTKIKINWLKNRIQLYMVNRLIHKRSVIEKIVRHSKTIYKEFNESSIS